MIDGALRVMTVWSPDWSMAAVGIPADVPAAVLRARRVIARSPAAADAGVRIGHSQREAQRQCPEVQIHRDDPARTARNFEPVVRAVADLAPRLEVVAPGWICLAVRGPARYFGGESAVAQRVEGLVGDLTAWPVGVGIADGRFAAAVAARDAGRGIGRDLGRSGPVVVPAGGSAEFLRDRSLRSLEHMGEVPAALTRLWEQLGLRTCGDLAALSVTDVLGRFGPMGVRAHHLAAGRDPQPMTATDPPGTWEYERVLPEPVLHLETVVFVAKQLADQMWADLAGRGRVCTRIEILCETEHGERSLRSWYVGAGFRAAQITERVRWQLEGWASTAEMTAGVVLIRLVAAEVMADSGVQEGLWGGRSRADEDALRAITRLTGMAGPDAVRVPHWQGGRLPAERYRWVPALSAAPQPERIQPKTIQPGTIQPGTIQPGTIQPGTIWPGALPAPSPTVVWAEPVEITVHDAAGAPVTVNGRGEVSAAPATLTTEGRTCEVMCWAGPWPLEQRWWEPQGSRRMARFQLLLADGSAVLVAVEHQRWWTIAVYG